MFEQAFRNIDDVLWKEAGCTTELDYTEQTSWLLFLKYLDGLEQDKAAEAALEGKKYSFILDAAYRWESWAAPKDANGQLDHRAALTGDDLRDFVDRQLFPYLHAFKQKAAGPNTIEYKIGEIFGEIKNKIHSGYNLREIIDHIDELQFRSQAAKHELSALYEEKIKRMGNAGRNGGEYYTPRPLIRAMVRVIQPKIGERIYDGACGSAGFLCEAFDYLKTGKLTTADLKTLQERTFYGIEKKSLAYVIAIMNMILHGVETPNIVHANTLALNLADVQDKDRFEVILANPPFGGKERKEVQQNFPIRTGETAFLFLQHFIKLLKAGGRAAVVIKNTFLSNTDNASVSLRKLLLESCNLHTILDCPGGTFQGAGVKTVVLFFEKGAPTRQIWYYQLDPGRNLGKTNPLNDADLAEFVALQKSFADSPKSWRVKVGAGETASYDLSVKNPNGNEAVAHRSPQAIMDDIAALDAESAGMLERIRKTESHLQKVFAERRDGWISTTLKNATGGVFTGPFGSLLHKSEYVTDGIPLVNPAHITATGIEPDLQKTVSAETAERLSSYIMREGDIVIGRRGEMGRCALVTDVEDGWLCGTGSFFIKPSDHCDPRYLVRLLRSDACKQQLEKIAGGAVMPNLSNTDLGNLPIDLPPLERQKAIVCEIETLHAETQRLESLYQQKLAALEELKESLLHQAFSGAL